MKITSNNNYLIKVKYVQICLCENGGEETDEKKIDMGEGRPAIIHPLPPHLNYNYCLHPPQLPNINSYTWDICY